MLARMLLDRSNVVASVNVGTMPVPNAGTYWNSIAAGNGVFVAIVGSAATQTTINECAVSLDGINWVAYALPRSQQYNGVFFLNNKFFMLARAGTGVTIESSDGQTWTDSTAPPAYYTAGAYGNGIYLLTGNNNGSPYGINYATSPDGVTWTSGTATLPSGASSGQQCVFANGLFFAYSASSSTDIAVTSSDGKAWTAFSLILKNSSSLAAGLLASNGNYAALYYEDRVSFEFSDGTTITHNDYYTAAQSVYGPYVSLCCGGGGYFAKFGAVSVRFSQDGLAWSYLPLPATFAGQACAFNPANRTYCAVGATQSVALTL